MSGAERLARCVTDSHKTITFPDGPKEALVVSLDYSLLSKNCYTKLFESGAFRHCRRCLKCRHECECEGDWEKELSSPAEPLIPKRMIRKSVWIQKGRKIPDFVELKNGWTLHFKSCESGRDKFQGDTSHVVWIDEEGGSDEDVMSEIERGMIDTEGYLWWTATPLACGVKLLEYAEAAQEEELERAEREAAGAEVPDHPFYAEAVLRTDDNVNLSRDAIAKFFDGMSEEEERVRREGSFLIQQGLVYKSWDKRIHIVETHPVTEDWTVYDLIDPGHANAFAVMFLAVKPDGDMVVFDELYLARTDVPEVVKMWRDKLSGKTCGPLGGLPHWSQRTMSDPAAKVVQAGMKMNSVRTQIENERRARNFRSFEGEHGVFLAPNAQQAGIFAVQALLKPRMNLPTGDPRHGKPILTVMEHCVHWQREIRRYRYPRAMPGRDINEKQGPVKKDDHLMDLTRYAALSNLKYVDPSYRPAWARGDTKTTLYQRLRRRKAKRQRNATASAKDCS